MDTDTFARILSEHDIRHRDVALIANVTRRAVSMWANGHLPVPRPVALMLFAIDDGLVGEKWLAKRLRQMTEE